MELKPQLFTGFKASMPIDDLKPRRAVFERDPTYFTRVLISADPIDILLEVQEGDILEGKIKPVPESAVLNETGVYTSNHLVALDINANLSVNTLFCHLGFKSFLTGFERVKILFELFVFFN